MNNFREVNDDILKEWFEFREDDISTLKSDEDRKHQICLEEVGRNILRNVPKHKQKYVKRQLDLLEDSIIDYIDYWNEKYYRNGFGDGVMIISGSIKS